MKIYYKGKYDGNPESLPHREHKPGAVQFKEFEEKKFAIFANIIALVITVALLVVLHLRGGRDAYHIVGFFLFFITLYPHEFLHAICFKEEVYIYTNWAKGILFVVGPESMSKARFIFMSLLPNILFGFVPFGLFLINPEWSILGTWGVFAIGAGAGDYYNVFNALTQMPKGAKTYLYQFHSYWYMPEETMGIQGISR